MTRHGVEVNINKDDENFAPRQPNTPVDDVEAKGK